MRFEYEQTWKKALAAPLPTAVAIALEKLEGVDVLLTDGDTDAVRAILSLPAIVTMGLKIAPRPKVPIQGAWSDCAGKPKCKEPLDDARSALQQLEEWCFANKIEFYNSADKNQVLARGDGVARAIAKIKASVDEPLELLEQGRDSLRQILAAR